MTANGGDGSEPRWAATLANDEEAAMLAKAIGTWFAVAALLLGASPAYGDTSAEIATRLAHARAALTATRGQLTLEQWALLSGKLAVRSMPWRTTTNSSRGQDGHWPLLNQWMTTPAAR